MEKNVLNYRIIIEKEKYEDGSTVYVAYCPSLGISDYGDTVEDALESIKNGIQLAVESLVKEEATSVFPILMGDGHKFQYIRNQFLKGL